MVLEHSREFGYQWGSETYRCANNVVGWQWRRRIGADQMERGKQERENHIWERERKGAMVSQWSDDSIQCFSARLGDGIYMFVLLTSMLQMIVSKIKKRIGNIVASNNPTWRHNPGNSWYCFEGGSKCILRGTTACAMPKRRQCSCLELWLGENKEIWRRVLVDNWAEKERRRREWRLYDKGARQNIQGRECNEMARLAVWGSTSKAMHVLLISDNWVIRESSVWNFDVRGLGKVRWQWTSEVIRTRWWQVLLDSSWQCCMALSVSCDSHAWGDGGSTLQDKIISISGVSTLPIPTFGLIQCTQIKISCCVLCPAARGSHLGTCWYFHWLCHQWPHGGEGVKELAWLQWIERTCHCDWSCWWPIGAKLSFEDWRPHWPEPDGWVVHPS